MKRITKAVLVVGAFGGTSASADPPPQPAVTLVPGPGNSYTAEWEGVAGRSYFLQFTTDLVSWNYAPMMRFGSGSKSVGLTSSSPFFSVRLNYHDYGWVTSLQEAEDADFDSDGIPNLFEIDDLGTDPLDKGSAGGDSDADGLVDGWEIYYFGDLTTAVPGESLEADGLTNKEKSDLGLDPNVDYSSPTASQPSRFTYDLTGRLTGVTAPVAAAAYTPDEAGNILIAQ